MTEWLRQWIFGLAGASLVSACALSLLPKGPLERVTRLVCGIVLTLSLIAPLTDPDMGTYSLSLAQYRNTVAALTQETKETEERLNRLYIEEECEAYIVDEAQTLGMVGRAEVRARWLDNCWVPWSVELFFPADAAQRQRLSGVLVAQLGIPEERQSWHE